MRSVGTYRMTCRRRQRNLPRSPAWTSGTPHSRVSSASPTLLVDSDALLALAGGDVLDRALALLGLDSSSARRLPPLPHMIRRERGGIARQWTAEARTRALATCAHIAALDHAP